MRWVADEVRRDYPSAVAAKVRYETREYATFPESFPAGVRLRLDDGRELERHVAHQRGGVHDPMDAAQVIAKFRANAAYGGWPEAETRRLEAWCERLFEQNDLRDLPAFRGP